VEAEIESIFKAMGKNKTKSKVTKIFKEIDNSNAGFITSDQFITYIVEKRKLKAAQGDNKTKEKGDSQGSKKEEKKETKKEPRRSSRTSTKKSNYRKKKR